ncbi:RNA polymerase sigma factor [Marinicella sp. W31]|uniref:RNA polymerase sigma factor n=1 Tax=Marinicella sp. W31 TaxID=3023713 RepID=UPI003756F1E5
MKNSLESTATLLAKVRKGDDTAKDRLCAMYLPILRRWAHGRLPVYARDLSETDDLVQASLIKALNKLDSFSPQHEGAFLAYLRKIMINNIRDEIRRSTRETIEPLNDTNAGNDQPTALEQAVGKEILEKYESALLKMSESSREAVILRVEFGFSYPEIAVAMNSGSANSARMMVSRALHQLAERM